MIHVLQYVRGDGGNCRYFYPKRDTDTALLRHLIGKTPHDRFEEYRETEIKRLADAHGWRMIEVDRE